MAASLTISPLNPGSRDEWRAFCAELSGRRRAEWAQSQRRRGIRREAIWLMDEPPRAAVLTEGTNPAAAAALSSSDDPFDVWYRERLDALLGEGITAEPIFDSRPRAGSWRGLRYGRQR